MMNFFSVFLSGKLFICPQILNDRFTGQSNFGYRSWLFMTLNISCQSHLGCKVSFEKSTDSLMGLLLQVTNCFSFAAFKTFSLYLCHQHFNYDVSWSGPLCIHLVWDSVLPGLACLFLSPNQERFVYFFKQISNFLLFFFSFWHLYDTNIGMLEVVPGAAYTILIFLDSSFFLFF